MIQIGYTKKLLDYLGVVPAEIIDGIDPLFCFSANLIVLNRRKCIVVVNDATCCGFILYGVTANDKKDIHKKLEAGLRNMLESENFAEDVIDRYIADCAFPAAITKTADRSAVSKLNQYCETLTYYEKCFEPDDQFQTMLLPIINDDFKSEKGSKGKDFFSTWEKQERLMKERYGRIYHCRTGVFDITLNLDTPCVRRVKIPMDFSIFYMHDVIQNIFNWKNCHLHEFILARGKDGRPTKTASTPTPWDIDTGCERLNERELKIEDVFSKRKIIEYEYDPGDGWEHEVRLVEIIEDDDISAPVCTEADGDAPPEDCGGPYGFSELKRILSDPKDPEYINMLIWYGSSSIRQKSIQEINYHLRRRYLAGAWHLYYRFE